MFRDMNTPPHTVEIVASVLFTLALIHTFSTKLFEHLAHSQPRHAGIWHLLGEVEIVFGFWAMILILSLFAIQGVAPTLAYLDGLSFTEPLFVFSIMVIAASKPILSLMGAGGRKLSGALPGHRNLHTYWVTLALIPLAGSFITEPGAMTLAALLLRVWVFDSPQVSSRLKYATLGVLFVNVSIGGAMTPFAAPPILMVARPWAWDLAFTLHTYAWRVSLAVLFNAWVATWIFRHELRTLQVDQVVSPTAWAVGSDPLNILPSSGETGRLPLLQPVPTHLTVLHVLLLVGVVAGAHHPPIFIGLLLFFMGIATAYPQHQDRLILREGLLVAYFLSGLIVLGNLQHWWLQPTISGLNDTALFWGAVGLTAVMDNAALTYMGTLVQGISDESKYALVAGALTGGGLTVIANAPNPAGVAIVRRGFDEGAIHPGGLFLAAILPTLVAVFAFRVL